MPRLHESPKILRALKFFFTEGHFDPWIFQQNPNQVLVWINQKILLGVFPVFWLWRNLNRLGKSIHYVKSVKSVFNTFHTVSLKSQYGRSQEQWCWSNGQSKDRKDTKTDAVLEINWTNLTQWLTVTKASREVLRISERYMMELLVKIVKSF